MTDIYVIEAPKREMRDLAQKIEAHFQRVEALLHQLVNKQELAMATISDLTAAVAAQTTVTASVDTLLSKIATDLKAALAGNNPPAAVQAILDGINANTSALSAAVTANTPAAPGGGTGTIPGAGGTSTIPGSPTVMGGGGASTVPAGATVTAV